MPLGVNEEGWAREVRYKYFVELANELKINNVLIAHNEDDLIETFLIQKKRRGIVSYYGLNKEIQIENVKFLRPLLNYKKEDLLKYCNNYNVHYGFDFSNFDTKYLRNNLRRNIVVKLTNTERHNLLNEIKILNEKNLLNIELLRNVFSQKYLETCKLIELSKENLQLCVINYLNYKNIYLEISKGFINELYSLIRTKKSWHKITQNGIILSIDYGYFGVYKIKEDSLNKITINKNSSKFEILKNSSYEIKNNLPLNSKVKFKNGTKKLGRCFIDWKIPYPLRMVWPIVVNENNEIIYIPKYDKNYRFENDSLLVFNTDDFIN